jgi:hypothetical protein
MSPFLLTPTRAAAADSSWSGADWVLGVVLPLLVLAAGVVLLLRGRAALAEATRVRSGFGGPPGTLDVGTQVGPGAEDHRRELLAAQRLRLRGLVLVGVGVVWLLVTLVVALL